MSKENYQCERYPDSTVPPTEPIGSRELNNPQPAKEEPKQGTE